DATTIPPRRQPRSPGRRSSWPTVARWSNAHAAGLHGNNGAPRQFIAILHQHLLANRTLLPCADVDEPHDAAMRQVSSNRQFAEVLIDRDEHTLLSMPLRQNLLVPRVVRQITGPLNVVAGRLKLRLGAAPNAGVEQ